MKTQIITLESHDDLISIRDRMSWAKTPRILLIWPKGEPVQLRPLDLKVLQRHARALGAQLAVVTRGEAIRRKAQAAGLPVFESSAAAQREAWPPASRGPRQRVRPPRRDLRELRAQAYPLEARWRTSLAGRVLAFAGGVLAVLALAGIFIPRASITLYPESQVQQLTFPVAASPVDGSVVLPGSLPANVEKVVLSGSRALTVDSGHITIPQTPAHGVVRFRNLTPAQMDIPAGTVVYVPDEPAIRFKTINATVLTAGLDQFVEVPVEAVNAGSAGNLEAGRLQGIEGSLGLSVVVDNLEPMSGGSDRSVIGPDENDRALIRNELIDVLMPQAQATLKERLAPGMLLIEDSGSVSQVLEEVYDPPAGQAGTRLHLAAQIEYSFRIVSEHELARLAESVLNSVMPQGFEAMAGSLSFAQASRPQTDTSGVTRWQVHAERRILRSVDAANLLVNLQGRTRKDAERFLGGVSAWEQEPRILMQPAWWPWLPMIPFRTSVILQ